MSMNTKSRGASKRLLKRDPSCHYCNELATTVDHIVPRARGGTDGLYNLVPCCVECNQYKADKMPTCPCNKCVTAMMKVGPLWAVRARLVSDQTPQR